MHHLLRSIFSSQLSQQKVCFASLSPFFLTNIGNSQQVLLQPCEVIFVINMDEGQSAYFSKTFSFIYQSPLDFKAFPKLCFLEKTKYISIYYLQHLNHSGCVIMYVDTMQQTWYDTIQIICIGIWFLEKNSGFWFSVWYLWEIFGII